jgi:uncharacterized protein
MATYKLIKSSEQNIARWSGGTTKELYIYPVTAKYVNRDFDFRISSAVVECETSKFTALPSVLRYIMILQGQMTLQHENHHSVLLKKFDVDQFWGDWNTVSFGQATDFNLMCRNDFHGNLNAYVVSEEVKICIPEKCQFCGYYLFKGIAKFHFNDTNIVLQEGDFIIFSALSDLSELLITVSTRSEIIEIQVFT